MTDPRLSPEKQKLRDLLRKTPRHLGQVNEIRLLCSSGVVGRWLFTGVLLLLFSFFGVFGGLVDLFRFSAPGTTKGQVADVYEGNASFVNKTVMVIEFTYDVNQQTYRGFSHKLTGVPGVGTEASIEYNQGNPNISRIDGTNYGLTGPTVSLIMLLFPLATFRAGLLSWVRGLMLRDLLCSGEVGEAIYKRKEATAITINDQTVFRLYYDLTVNGQTREIMVKTHKTDELLDEAVKLMLYDPADEKRFYLMDQIPCKLTMKTPGEWETDSSLTWPVTKLCVALSIIGVGMFKLVQTVITG